MVKDYPVPDMIKQANQLLASNPSHVRVFQKFTCSRCKERVAVATPNTFYRFAECCKCGYENKIEKCGYMAHFSMEPFEESE